MTKNVTLRMDEEVLRKLRHQAVDSHQSLSAWIVTVLSRETRDSAALNARDQAVRRLDRGFRLGGKPLAREAAHAR